MNRYKRMQKNINDTYHATAALLATLYPEQVPLERLITHLEDVAQYITKEQNEAGLLHARKTFNISEE